LQVACSKEKKTPCNDDFAIEAPIVVNLNASRMSLSDTLLFLIEVPFKGYNLFTGDSINSSSLNDLWGGFTILEFIKDSIVVPGGGPINSIPARTHFNFFSNSNNFEIPIDAGRQSPEALFFKYEKGSSSFIIRLSIIPKKMGTFTFNFLNSGFRNVLCFNKVTHQISNYTLHSFSYLIEEAIGKSIPGGTPNNKALYIIRVE
jgi:hypothetical protein